MNELLAIILIVFICCAMFLAWLISMATCPDRMVNLISGGTSTASSSKSESIELMTKSESTDPEIAEPEEDTFESDDHLKVGSKPASRVNSKKLSVVPEQDEQLTLQSSKFTPHPTILEAHYSPIATHHSGARLITRYSETHIDLIDEEPLPESPPIDLVPMNLPDNIPVSCGGAVAVHQPYSKIGDRVFKCYSYGFVNKTQMDDDS
uniref:Secreted protein n=1 Tax=Panagrellus redivivus TaxID=6233 RepID=A0A7E4VP24_PANRE